MKLKVCADYSFIAIAFSCQAEKLLPPCKWKQQTIYLYKSAFLLYARRIVWRSDRFIIVRSILVQEKRTDVSVSSGEYIKIK